MLVLQGTNWPFKVYHDGAEIGSQGLNTYQPQTTGSGDVVLGNELDSDPHFAVGSTTTGAPTFWGTLTVDELVMWNEDLSAAQVTQVYNMVP